MHYIRKCKKSHNLKKKEIIDGMLRMKKCQLIAWLVKIFEINKKKQYFSCLLVTSVKQLRELWVVSALLWSCVFVKPSSWVFDWQTGEPDISLALLEDDRWSFCNSSKSWKGKNNIGFSWEQKQNGYKDYVRFTNMQYLLHCVKGCCWVH